MIANNRPFAKLPPGKCKLYFVNFYNKENKKYHFSKTGHTHYIDAGDRFRFEPHQYRFWNIKVMFSLVGPEDIILKEEEYIHSLYKKDFYLPESMRFKGIKEIRILNYYQINEIIMYMKDLREKLKTSVALS
jgi:hypothetical protein